MTLSLDGYVNGPDNDMSWLMASEELWDEMFKDLASVDTFLMGANMSQEYAGYWNALLTDDSAPADMRKFAELDSQANHVVFSKSIKKIDFPNYRIAADAATEIPKLKEEPGKDIFVWGGASFAAWLINSGLVDEYRLSLSPHILGGGLSLFDHLKRKKLELVKTRPLKSGLVILNYTNGGA
jgi:Dihydrofolate reductase